MKFFIFLNGLKIFIKSDTFLKIKKKMAEEIKIKIVIVGETGVGKTSLMQMYTEGTFSAQVSSTIGSTCAEKELIMNDQKYVVSVWDTAGQESYRTIVPMYFRGAAIAIIVFDVTNQKSFDSVDYWKKTIQENLNDDVVIVLCANKIDLFEKRAVADEIIQAKARSLEVPYFFTSAATGMGVNNMFESSLSQVMKTYQTTKDETAIVKNNRSCMC